MNLCFFKCQLLPVVYSSLFLLSCSSSRNQKTKQKLRAETPGVAVLLVDVDHPVSTINKNIYGQFLEHIFNSVHGGLYAEQVQGQGFEGKDFETYWKPLEKNGKVEPVDTSFKKGLRSMRLSPKDGVAGI